MANTFVESTFKRKGPEKANPIGEHSKADQLFELPLRPQSLKDFVGQESVRERLEVFTQASKGRSEPLGHVLFSGPPGLGKTSLAHILSKEMGTNLVVTSGPVIEKAGDLAGLLTSLKEGDILFIDEIHRLSRVVEEYLYPAMEDFKLDLMIDSGPQARSVQVKLEKFTLVAATTRVGLISSPLRSRFALNVKLDYYPEDVLGDILARSARILKVEVSREALLEIAKRARGTPRIANSLLRWVRDYSQVKESCRMSSDIVIKALKMLQIDDKGLDETDKRIISIMLEHYRGGPVGIGTIAAMIGEEIDTLEEVHEPYLMLLGLLQRTPRGRVLTDLALRLYDNIGE